jgi:hypothetical protein
VTLFHPFRLSVNIDFSVRTLLSSPKERQDPKADSVDYRQIGWNDCADAEQSSISRQWVDLEISEDPFQRCRNGLT